ncbi:MAG TPA: DUF1552 domain-containing protein [Vicinamibacterales bacterium]
MFITNKPLDRRTFLRGMGATVALPLLDAMIPARTLLAFNTARAVPRLAFVYFPHGAIMDEWTAAGRILQPLAPFHNRLTIVSGMENRHAYGPVHAITPGTWLSGMSAREPSSSADQLAADHVGGETVLPSIAVATEAATKISAGIWEGEYDESYGKTISFRAGAPVPMEFRPRAVFDTLFHLASGSTSVLDRVADDAASLRKQLGPADRSLLSDYLETVRDVERRVDQDEIATSFTGRMALMFDLIALAFRADLTRVASMMMAAEASARTYEHLGIHDSFHALSHHQNDPDKIDKLVRIQTFHTTMLAAFIQTLAAQPDGNGSILDRSLILFGSNMSNSYAHDHFPLPLAVVGGGCGRLSGGQHLRYPDRTPLSNLLLTLLRRADVPVQAIGDSTGECSELESTSVRRARPGASSPPA